MVENHVVLASMPKSATVFVSRALMMSADLEQMPIAPAGPFPLMLDAQLLNAFVDAPRALTATHTFPTNRNVDMLCDFGIRRVIVLTRDPRDAMLSWWHHLLRPDIRTWHWHHALMVAEKVVPENYYELDRDGQIACLVQGCLPRMALFLAAWAGAKNTMRDRIEIHHVAYEDLIKNPASHIQAMLDFCEIDADKIVLPSVPKSNETEIDIPTHFRRGMAGAWRDELTPEQQAAIAWSVDCTPAKRYQ